MIEAAPRPLAGILGPRAGAWLTALHRAEGVVLRTGVTVARDLGDALELADGTRVEAAHVLAGIGVAPGRGLARRQRARPGRRGGRRRPGAPGSRACTPRGT